MKTVNSRNNERDSAHWWFLWSVMAWVVNWSKVLRASSALELITESRITRESTNGIKSNARRVIRKKCWLIFSSRPTTTSPQPSENRKSWFLIFLLKLTCSTKAKTHFYLLILYVTVITKHFYFIISDFKLKNQNMFWIFHNPLLFQFCFWAIL